MTILRKIYWTFAGIGTFFIIIGAFLSWILTIGIILMCSSIFIAIFEMFKERRINE